MNEFKEKWINDIRDRMENHSEPLPAYLWDKIEAETAAPKAIPLWKKWYSVAAAAAAIAIVSSVSFGLFNNYVDEETVKMANVIPPAAGDDVAYAPIVAEAGKDEAMPLRGAKVKAALEAKAPDAEVGQPSPASAAGLCPEEDKDTADIAGKKEDDGKKKRIAMMKADREVQRRNASYLAMADKDAENHGYDKILVGIATGNVPYSSSNGFGGMSRLSSRKSVQQTNDAVISESSDGKVSYSQVLFNNRDKQTYTNVKHRMPVTVGANVKWNIDKNWGVETGLNYTYLYSELQSGANSYVEDKQKLHYVGIPLKLHRSIWMNKTVSFYASAGGMVEKCVSGNIETVCVGNNGSKSYQNESVGDKPWQFSVNASLGAQINFLKFMGLYVEPGMSYYFDDGSELLTIRKDKPFNFNLQLGVRFNIGN